MTRKGVTPTGAGNKAGEHTRFKHLTKEVGEQIILFEHFLECAEKSCTKLQSEDDEDYKFFMGQAEAFDIALLAFKQILKSGED